MVNKYKRNCIADSLKDYCLLSKEGDSIEITEWANGEGYDISISGCWNKAFSITHGEFEAMKRLIKTLRKEPGERIK